MEWNFGSLGVDQRAADGLAGDVGGGGGALGESVPQPGRKGYDGLREGSLGLTRSQEQGLRMMRCVCGH